jgi:dTDP-4-amino-4,6-dideoxygalactose transaminase
MTAVPAIDFRAQWKEIGPDVLAATERVGASGWYVLGQEVERFEHALAGFAGVRHAIGCASGLDGIEIGLRAGGLQAGQRVATSPLSAFATALAIVRAGGRPVYVDTDAAGLIDLDALEALAAGGEIEAVVPVHLYGHLVELERLHSLAREHGLLVVEDAAQAIGGSSGGRRVGQGSIAATSFYPTKNLGALGDGGAVLTDDDAVAATARRLRDYGQAGKYEHAVLGLNSRLDELHAAILRDAMLPRLEAHMRRRAEIATAYRAELRFEPIAPHDTSGSVWHLFPIAAKEREGLAEHLRRHGIRTAVHYPTLIPAQSAWGDARADPSAWPHAHDIARRTLSLPLHPYLSDAQVSAVIDACNER